MTSYIGGHDDNRIFHIDFSSFAISHTAFIENLEKDIPYIRMRFFDLIEQDDRIWMTPNCLSELSPFIMTDISRRSSDETRHTMRLHILTHIETDIGIWIVPEDTTEGFCGFCLSYTCGTQKEK
jgi:hypothetical protein